MTLGVSFARASWVWGALVSCLVACSTGTTVQKTGSQTNWLRLCTADADCGELDCLCGVCSSACAEQTECSALPGASCAGSTDPGAIAVCGGQAPEAGMCLPRCDEEECALGSSCVAGVCAPMGAPELTVTIDLSERYQSLVGFGASLAYAEDAIVAFPERESLLDAMFADSGFDIVRLRNRYEGDNADDLQAAGDIIAAAGERLGHLPTLLITEGSPPAALKANGSRSCAGSPETCTLARDADGAFDYAAFAEHWRASLEAHAARGIVPDYLSIQNNPDWAPPEDAPLDACRLLPEEGTEELMIDGELTSVPYPGYLQALEAVRAALMDGGYQSRLVAPEAGSPDAVEGYVARLDPATYEAVAFHLYYTTDATAVDVERFRQMREIVRGSGHPGFQTEMRADGLETAVLLHYSLVEADAAMYLQNDFIVPASNPEGDPTALIALTEDGFTPQAPYHALRHFARDTEPGWSRVAAAAESPEVLPSAWLSPEENALTVVLVNPGTIARTVTLDLGDALSGQRRTSRVTRTVFDGVERSVDLGALAEDGNLSLPGASIVTVALEL